MGGFRRPRATSQPSQERRAITDEWELEHQAVVKPVFWQPSLDEKGRPIAKPITLWSKAWNRACKKAKVLDLIPHDMRRAAARNLIRAGVDETVAMRLLGHQTNSTFRRYNITADDDLRDAVRKLSLASPGASRDIKTRSS